MRKKLLALILLVGLLLTACGGNKEKPVNSEKPSTENTDVESNTQVDTEDTKLSYWETKQVEAPTVAEVTFEEIKAFDNADVKTKMYSTFLTMTQDDLLNALQANKYITDTFELAKGTYEDIECTVYGDVGEQAKIIEQKYISGGKKGSSLVDNGSFYDLDFRLVRDTWRFRTPYKIELTLKDISVNKDVQKEMLSILTDVLGSDIANYIVYAEDLDGKTVSGEGLKEGQLSEYIEAGDAKYIFYRYVDYDAEEPNKSNIYFYIQLDKSIADNKLEYFTNGYTSAANDMKYKLSSIFKDITIDKNQFSNLFSEYMKMIDSGYVRTLIDNIYIDYEYGLNGVNRGRIEIESKCGMEEVANVISPQLNIDFEYAEKDSDIIDFELEIEGESMFLFTNQCETDEEKEAAYKDMIQDVAVQINKLFPSIDTSFINYDTCRKGHTEFITYNILGKDYNMKISISCGTTFADTMLVKYEINIE